MTANFRTFNIEPSGGLIENLPPLIQGATLPGSLITAQNFEPATSRGYTRISGFAKYSSTALSGTGAVLGAFPLNGGILACRGANIEHGTGGTWTSLSTSRAGAKKYQGSRYNWVTEKLIIVDSAGYPARWDGSTLDELDSTTDILGATSVQPFKRHMFFTKGQSIIFSAPGDETDYDGVNGAGIINVGREVYALREWRDSLYAFGPNHICKVTGNNSTDFAVVPVTSALGCVAPHSIQEMSGDIIFLGPDGLRTIAGTEKIGDTALDLLSESVDETVDEVISLRHSHEISTISIPSKSQFRLFYSAPFDIAGTERGLLGGFKRDPVAPDQTNWEWYKLKGLSVACSDWHIDAGEEVIVHGDFSGFVHQQEIGFSFDGANVDAQLSFPFWVYDDPEIRKVLQKIRLVMRTQGTTSITLSNDLEFGDTDTLNPTDIDVSAELVTGSLYGTAVYGTDAYSTDDLQNLNLNLIGSAKNHSISLTSNDVNAPYTLKTIFMQYVTSGSRL